jgi:Carboxypeptidase regulatory-like domain/TonB dependent receptor-like, beta-barrel
MLASEVIELTARATSEGGEYMFARCCLTVGIAIVAILAFPVIGLAQEATIGGTVRDTTGGVLPGVAVRAVHEATGNTFETFTDERGSFQMPVRTGNYRVTAELSGFATVSRSALQVLVGQQVVVNLEMAPSTVQETVTVTGEAPLIDVTSSQLSGNIDPRQLSELPVLGRNWLDLTQLAPGARLNAAGNVPTVGDGRGTYQLNVDGQQVTNYVQYSRPNPQYSRDAIAEFEFVANRFDATQGRSMGVQVNAITKSGTNIPSGTFSSYFRDDRFNAADHVVTRVLPYSNQQISGTYGGPIRRDRVHFFVNFEYEREPRTSSWTTPYAPFNQDLTGTRWNRKAGGRVDVQFSNETRLSVRGNHWRDLLPFTTGSAITTPANTQQEYSYSDQAFGVLTQVLSNRMFNEIKAGYARSGWENTSPVLNNPNAGADGEKYRGQGSPVILLRGLTIGTGRFTPQWYTQNSYSVRDDFTHSFSRGGRHELKLGGEYIYHDMDWMLCNVCNGELDARGGPVPANIGSLFPDLWDFSTWNLNPLSPITVRWRQGIGQQGFTTPRHVYGIWVQDNWTLTSRLTLNLGLRYDLQLNSFNNKIGIPPFLPPDRPDDTDNISPRFGFALSVTDRTVLRGGFGKYFGDIHNPHFTQSFSAQISAENPNDGRPDFASNPYNGPKPTYEALLPRLCTTANVPGCLRPEYPFTINGPMAEIPYSYQASIGMQRQLGSLTGIEADYVFTGERATNWNSTGHNINVSYNPATGTNYPFTDISRRPWPELGRVDMWIPVGARSNYHSMQMAFTKRFGDGWQASATYLLSGFWDAVAIPFSGLERVTFPLAPDFGGEYTLAAGDQRHRAVFNGIWEVGYGFQLSGLYFYGSGERYSTNYGTDLRDLGGAGQMRLRPNGTIVPRNDFVGKSVHRVDLRVQRQFRFGARAAIDGIAEVFNLFDRANYGAYTTQEVNPNYGTPSQNQAVAYQPRMLQLGFRFTF